MNETRPNDPRKVDDGPVRQAIERGQGVTDTERYLAGLADRSFLNLWSYPNVFIDKKVAGKGDGKELCDLLVICGDDVLIFSDKAVAWPSGEDIKLAWCRWYKRAIRRSVDQIRGAERWLSQFPKRIFIDRKCTQRLPIALPPPQRRKVHGIVVANGAAAKCQSHLGSRTGSLMVVPSIKGPAHFEGENIFAIGDVDPANPFVHVFNEAALDIVMKELDTIFDFTAYLAKKENLIRSGRLLRAAGEEELVAEYLVRMNAQGQHDFSKPDGSAWGENDRVTYNSGLYAALTNNQQYIAKKEADKVSYAWDDLITLFTNHMLAGTSFVPVGQTAEIRDQEIAVREMALLSRFVRRSYGAGFLDALREGQKNDRFMRAFIAGPEHLHSEIGFFILTLKIPSFELDGGYQQYRNVRMNILGTYAHTLLRNNPHLRRIVGIATEPRSTDGQDLGSSEDLIYVERPEWTEQLLADLDKRGEDLRIAQPGNVQAWAFRDQEFPDINGLNLVAAPTRMNRRQRRAMEAERRRRKRKGR